MNRLGSIVIAITLIAPSLEAQRCQPTHWWPGEQTTCDVTGQRNGTHNGTQPQYLQSSIAGAAFDFDGATDYLRIAHHSDLDFGTGDLTISLWIRPVDTENFGMLVHKRSGSANRELELRVGVGRGDGRIFFQTNDGESGNATSPNPVPVNAWTHVAAVRRGPTIELFVNGVSVDTHTYSQTANLNSTSDLLLGEFASVPVPNVSEPFHGGLDEVQIYRAALSLAEIQALADPAAPTAMHWWPAENSTADVRSGAAAIWEPLGAGSYVPGNGKGFALDGTTSHLRVLDQALPSFGVADVTFDVWVNPSRTDDFHQILHKRDGSGSHEFELRIGKERGDGFVFVQTNNGESIAVVSQNPLQPGSPVRLSVVRCDRSLALYINGALDGITFGSAAQDIDSASDLLFGQFVSIPVPNISAPFAGVLDEVRIFSSALTSAQISDLHNRDEPPTAVAGPDQSARAGTSIQLDGSGSCDDNTPPEELIYAWLLVSRPPHSTATLTGAGTATPSFDVDISGTYSVQLIVQDAAGNRSMEDLVTVANDNLAPIADAGLDRTVTVNEVVSLSAAGSIDQENDPLSFSWTLTSPPGSAASLAGASTPMASFQPDLPGDFTVQLTVSDPLGPGIPVTVVITAGANSDLAIARLRDASILIRALGRTQVTNRGNRRVLQQLVRQATRAVNRDRTAQAVRLIQRAVRRVDGVTLRGIPDGRGPQRDWVVDPSAQVEIYDAFAAALAALLST